MWGGTSDNKYLKIAPRPYDRLVVSLKSGTKFGTK